MNDSKKDYKLGTNVTSHASPREQRGTIRYVVDFPLSDFAELEAASDAQKMTVSQFVVDALRHRTLERRGPVRLMVSDWEARPERSLYRPKSGLNGKMESRASSARFDFHMVSPT